MKKKNISSIYKFKNSKYIEIDNLYYAGLICIDYYREQTDILLKNINRIKH